VLPFLAFIAVRWGWWLAYWWIDAILFIGLFRWYHDQSSALAYQAATFGAWSKTMFLALAAIAVMFTPLAIRDLSPPASVARPSRVGPKVAAARKAGRAGATRSRPRPTTGGVRRAGAG